MGADTVFISYSHDSREHSDRVLALSNKLRELGVDAEIDQYQVRPSQGWARWCDEQLRPENAKFVLVICTPTYRDRVENRVTADEGRGVFWEGGLIYDYIYEDKANARFIPILLDPTPPDCIPRPLKNHPRYRLTEFELSAPDFEALYRELTDQPAVIKPALQVRVDLGRGASVAGAGAAPAVAPALPVLPAQTTFGVQIHADANTPEKTVFKDGADYWCPEVIVLPSGVFFMGSADEDQDAYDEEKPAHLVRIDYKFALGRYPITFAQFDYFCEQTHRRKPSDEGWGRGDKPVINVSWLDAQAYAEWLSEKLQAPYRLPTEAEWEYACRAGTTTRFYCGNQLNPKHANYNGQIGRTSTVQSHSANPWGLYDMHGNVWEYVEDSYHPSYEGAPVDGRSWIDGKPEVGSVFRVVRGGSFSYPAKDNRSAVRCNHDESVTDVQHGIRVARSL